MSRMVLTQKQLEQQIRNLTSKGKPVSNITGINGANMTGGISSNAITPIDSPNNTTFKEGEHNNSDTFAEFVRNSSVTNASSFSPARK